MPRSANNKYLEVLSAASVETVASGVASSISSVALAAAASEGFAGYDVILLIGQSNMVGTARTETTNALLDYTSPRIEQWGQSTSAGTNERPCLAQDPLQHADGLGVGGSLSMSFARWYENGLAAGRKVLLVPCAWGGTGFSNPNTATTSIGGASVTLNWLANTPGNLLDLAIKRVNRAMAYHPIMNPAPAYAGSTPPTPSPYNSLKAVLWHQGENDVFTSVSEAQYRAYLQDLVADVRTRVSGASDATPFIVGLPTPAFVASNSNAGPIVVLPKVGNVAYFGRPNCGFADSLTPTPLAMNAENNIHFSSQGSRDYGARYYERFLRMTTAPTLTGARATPGSSFFDPVRVSWDTGPYLTYLGAYASNNMQVWSAATTGNASSIPYANLQPSTNYRINLLPASKAGVYGPSSNVALTTAGVPIPSISGLVATAGNTYAEGVRISWATANATQTSVGYGAGSSPGSFTPYVNAAGNSVVVPPGVLLPQQLYTFQAVPYNATFPGAPATTTATTLALPPPTVANLSLIAGNNASVGAAWTSNNTTHSIVSVGVGDPPGSFANVGNTATNGYTVTGLQPLTLHTVRVSPYFGAVSGTAVTGTVTTGSMPIPSLSNFAVVAVSNSTTVNASWTSANTTNVSLLYGAGASPGSFTFYGNSSSTSLALSNALASTTLYTIKAVPYNAQLAGTPATAQVTTNAPVSAPLILRLKPASNVLPTVDNIGNALTPINTPAIYSDATRGNVFDTRNGHFNTSVALTASYTKTAWAYALATGGIGYNIISSITSAPQHYFFVDTGVLKNGHFPTNNVNKWVADPLTFPLNTWTHVAVTYDNTANTMVLYRNGIAVANTTNAAMSWSGGGAMSLGHLHAYYVSGNPSDLRWNGYLDDLRTYAGVLSPTNIQNIYNGLA